MTKIEIPRNDPKKQFKVKTGAVHTFVLEPGTVSVIELEGLHFNLDSAVLLPIEPTGVSAAEQQITPFDVLAGCMAHAEDHSDDKLIVTGHTDTSGGADMNVKLSDLRSHNVLDVLVGDRDDFVKIAKSRHKVKDYQRILKWVAATEGFDCDVKVTDHAGQDTTTALRNFQQAYNDAKIGKEIEVNGSLTDETWGAFFDMYQRELCRAVGEEPDDLSVLDSHRSHLKFFDEDRKAVGCGENFPVEARGVDGFRSAENRRCEICFLEPGNDPPLDCHPGSGKCNSKVCQLNDPKAFKPAVVPIDPNNLPRNRCVLHLRLAYLDPVAGQPDHPFPKDLPLRLTFDDGSTQDEKLGDDGKLRVVLDRRKKHAKLSLKPDQATFVGSASSATPAEEPRDKFAALDALQSLLDKAYRVFQLPAETTLRNAEWKNLPAGADTDGLDIDQPKIGAPDSPLTLVLDPHWQHFKLLYHDRRLLQTLSLPPIVVEAFDGDVTGDPASRSNWLTDPQGSQAMPWILRRNADDSARNKPDDKISLRFRTAPSTFVDTSAGTVGGRKLVTGGSPPADALVVRGEKSSVKFDQANAARLSFYDLPEEWRSKGQFVRLSAGTGAKPSAIDDFAKLAGSATTDDKPLMFQLDDIVLCDDSSGTLSVAKWTPASDRAAIFSHTFKGGTNLSPIGLYKPDSGNKRSFLSQQVADLTNQNLIADYPDWTRLVITRGNLYEVFDRRVPLAAGKAVGARAAVRWVDSPVIGAPGTSGLLGTVTVKPSCMIHPFYSQAHHHTTSSSATQSSNIGRFDLVLLRCCGVEADGKTESAQVMSYIRFAFNFNPPSNPTKNPTIGPDNPPAFDPTAVVMNLPASDAADWVETALKNIPNRWTGPETGHNPTEAAIVTRSPGDAGGLKARYVMFAQSMDRKIAHFELGMFKKARAYMRSSNGYGTLSSTDNQSTTFFTAAHETGHGVSHPDEYIEQVFAPPGGGAQYPTPWVLSFDSNQPGGPYQQDEVNLNVPGAAGMMNGNDKVRGRYFWHVAEWMRVNLNTDFDVSHDNLVYTLPPITQSNIGLSGATADRFTLASWPLRQTYGVTRSGSPHVQHDVFLHQFGKDAYSNARLPHAVQGLANPAPASVPGYDGILIALVRMTFAFPSGTTNAAIHTWLQGVDAGIVATYSFKWKAAGTAGSSLSRVLLHFSPRYFAPNYAPNPRTSGITPHITVKVLASGGSGWTKGNEFTARFNAAGSTALVNAFGDMIGLTGANSAAASYNTLAGEVLSGASVSSAAS
jgi:hypothetical protein